MSNNTHTCDAFVLTCIDFRFHQLLAEPLKQWGIRSYDLKSDAGGVKFLVSPEKPAVRDWILENMAIARRLHDIKKIVLINHYDCGAYGGNAAWASDAEQFAFQTEQLLQAGKAVALRFPDLEVLPLFAQFSSGQVQLVKV